MKKIIIGIVLVLAVLGIVAIAALFMFLGHGVKKGVETVGPMLMKVPVQVGGVSLSPFSGSGKVTGMVIGNPDGFKTPAAMSVGSASLSVSPGSIFSDKIVVRSIRVEAPEITYETDLKNSNLGKIQSNLEAFMGPGSTNAPADPGATSSGSSKKLQVDEFLVTGGKINVSLTALAGKTVTVPLPELRFTDLGKGPEGITAAALTKEVLDKIIAEAVKASSGAVADLGRQAGEAAKALGKTATDSLKDSTKGIGDLLKKK